MYNIFDEIKRAFNFDIREFFVEYNVFVEESYPILLLQQKTTEYSLALSKLSKLIQLSEEILSKINNITISSTVQYYSIVEEFEDCRYKLLTYKNLDKWSSSNESNSKKLEYTLSTNENLEIASEAVGYLNRDQGALDLALNNSIKELDYDLEGGLVFSYNFQYSFNSINLSTVVDRDLAGEKLLSLDLNKKIRFVEEDLEALTYRDTFNQTVKLLLNLKRGDNSEYRTQGIDKRLLVNRVTSATTFPIIIRQLSEAISTDDTIRKFVVKNVWYEQDSQRMECEFYSQISSKVNSTL